jgi:RimJ/RimL family protein N-acetyltransferase
VELLGSTICLAPLTKVHVGALWEAANDPRIWELAYGPSSIGEMETYVETALDEERQGRAIPFSIRSAGSDRIVGSTRIKEIDLRNRCCEIGSTWLIPELWKTGANRESKYLLLSHAFEVMGMQRVGFMVGAQNWRSRQAMERLGATQEGILRSRQLLPSGERRDHVVYSILDSDWKLLRGNLNNAAE